MGAKIRIGARCATISGLPVQVVDVAAGVVILQSLVSDNRLRVPDYYPLRPADPGNAAFEVRLNPYNHCPDGAESGPKAPPKPIAPLIDAMLLAGNHTMRGILREVRRRASAACKGKDLAANVRARLHWLKRKGYRLEKIGQGQLRLVPPVGAASQ